MGRPETSPTPLVILDMASRLSLCCQIGISCRTDFRRPGDYVAEASGGLDHLWRLTCADVEIALLFGARFLLAGIWVIGEDGFCAGFN